jgi:2-polyprenyl-3-methyl-5-hydroxy-6-metoxy-1,4-benzoquinol methylase
MNIAHSSCPVCNSSDLHFALTVKDHTVSLQTFEIWLCNKCTLKFTQQIPTEEEIGSFYQSETYISHSDTKKGLVNYLYHLVRKITLRSKKKLIENITGSDHGNILDIGAGTGAFLNTMQIAGWQVTGLEPDILAKDRARELYNINLQPTTVFFDLPAESYNAITMWHVLEHVHRLHDYMEQLKKLLKPHGTIFIAVPNYTSYDEKIYKEFWAAYDVPRHLYHFSPIAMTNLIQQHGLRLRSIKAMWYDSFYVSMLSEKYKGSNNMISAILTGLISDLKALQNRRKASSLIYIITK